MTYYIRILLRSLFRNKTLTLINLVGLTAGLAGSLLIYLWVQDERSVDKFHANDERLYRVMEYQNYSDRVVATTSTPYILADNLKIDFPEVEYSATITWLNRRLLTHEDLSFKERGFHVGKDFFQMFSYPLLEGRPEEVLKSRTSICISKELAIKFFKNVESAIGKTILYRGNRPFIVSGVFDDIPDNSTYQFDFVLPYEDYIETNPSHKNWTQNGPSTVITLKAGVDPDDFNNKITGYVKLKDSPDSKVDLFMKKYSDHYLYGKYSNGVQDGGRIEYVRLFSIIAIFILLIACVNFMNLATARASKRAQEVGIRKAIGANRGTLIKHFLSESMILTSSAMLFAYFIVLTILPQFNVVTGKNIVLEFTGEIVLASGLAVLITGALAGMYPAIYLSSFQPVKVFKGEVRTSLGEIWARKGLVIFQFTITIILLISVSIIYQQIQFALKKNLGYNKDNVISFAQDGVIRGNNTFFQELRNLPGVVSAAGSSHGLMRRENSTAALSWKGKLPGERISFEIFDIDYDFFNTMQLNMIEGRAFNKTFGSDSSSVIINESAARILGSEDLIGENMKLWDELDMNIVGVVQDFHYQSIHREVAPAFFKLGPTWNALVRIEAGNELRTLADIEELYKSYNPAFYFDFEFLDKSYEKLYKSETKVATLAAYFAGFAILISCLGLFGLASFTAERRIKEIGIRKVLGATVTNIVMMLSTDFTRLVVISIVIAIPISWYLMSEWLNNFAYKIDLGVWLFVGAAAASLIIAWLTVSSQAFRAASINPAKCLKDE